MNVPVSSRVNDLISSKCSTSYFLRVSKTDVIFVEVLPFLTPSQRDAGFMSSWFSEPYLQELVQLLRSHLEEYLHKYRNVNDKDSKPSKGHMKNFILSGDHLRAACNFKQNIETNYYLTPLTKKTPANSSESNEKFQEVTVLCEKLLIYVCPKSNSSSLHLKQLLTPQKDDSSHETSEDISKYFQPVSAK